MEKLRDILTRVEKPGRYIGEETNVERKAARGGYVSIALAFPDIYEIGMSYLGLKIIYHLLNAMDDIVCERVFAPWPDMEKELLVTGRKLFSLESKMDINRFDIVGFSLSYELNYTNVLNMLALSGITVRSGERGEEEPLVIAGGVSCFNPEPMSEFIDIFFIGEAEGSLPLFIDEYKRIKDSSPKRTELLKKLSFLPGVYVPSLYRAEYRNTDFLRLRPGETGIPEPEIVKNTVSDLGKAFYPTKQIVPLISTVHDRIAVEIMRGCPNKCRFCRAVTTSRPVRLRSPEKVLELAMETYRHTGYEQVSLLSLSSVNYPHIIKLLKYLNGAFRDRGIGVSVPSLRVDEAFYGIPEMISTIRKTGLTFAPESAGEGIRRAMSKNVDLGILARSAELAYTHGWTKLKLYFMVGFPGERESDIDDIMRLARELSYLRKKTGKKPAEISISVNPFVPKPHTPFQWLGMGDTGSLARAKDRLMSRSSKKTRVEFHDLNTSLLEACLSRGDRRMSAVIKSAWEKGAKMDSWSNFFDFGIWKNAFIENGLTIESCARGGFSLDAALPWGHIDTGINKDYLKAELMESGFYADTQSDMGCSRTAPTSA